MSKILPCITFSLLSLFTIKVTSNIKNYQYCKHVRFWTNILYVSKMRRVFRISSLLLLFLLIQFLNTLEIIIKIKYACVTFTGSTRYRKGLFNIFLWFSIMYQSWSVGFVCVYCVFLINVYEMYVNVLNLYMKYSNSINYSELFWRKITLKDLNSSIFNIALFYMK